MKNIEKYFIYLIIVHGMFVSNLKINGHIDGLTGDYSDALWIECPDRLSPGPSTKENLRTAGVNKIDGGMG
jgi:hypothetical protein